MTDRVDPLLARLDLARAAAHAAGERTLHYFQTTRFRTETKDDGSPVTDADRESEQTLRDMIRRAFPADGLLGEEYGHETGTSGWRWIIDPIDGTRSFIQGVPLFGVMIGVEHAGVLAAGVIRMPALGETVFAARGAGAFAQFDGRDATPARVSSAAALADGLLCTTSFDYFRRRSSVPTLVSLCEQFGSTRGWSDCYAHVLVATGRADACVEPVLKPWDIAATIPIIEEAGGRCTAFDGRVDAFAPNGVLTNGRIHEQVLAVLNRPAG